MKRILLGSDEAAFSFKEEIKQFLMSLNYEVIDKGVYNTEPSLYPDIAKAVAYAVRNREAERAILMCGTGIGMAISANKVNGIRAAVAHDHFAMERSILSNKCQIICFGSRIVAPIFAKSLIEPWLSLEFSNPESQKKIDAIDVIEREEKNNDAKNHQ